MHGRRYSLLARPDVLRISQNSFFNKYIILDTPEKSLSSHNIYLWKMRSAQFI